MIRAVAPGLLLERKLCLGSEALGDKPDVRADDATPELPTSGSLSPII